MYQAIMQAKFQPDGQMLASAPLADAANRIVEQIMVEAHRQGDPAIAESLQSWRELQPYYPQYEVLRAHLAQLDWWESAESGQRSDYVRRIASPLLMTDSVLSTLIAP